MTGGHVGGRLGVPRLYRLAGNAVVVFRESLESFVSNGNSAAAATLAYYAFLALMPFLLLVVFALGSVLSSHDAVMAAMRETLGRLFPDFSDSILQDVAALARRRGWGILGLILLLWSTTPFIGSFRTAVARIFRVKSRLHFLKGKVFDLAAVVTLLALFVFLAAGRVYSVIGGLFGGIQAGGVAAVVRAAVNFGVTALVLGFFYVVFAPLRLRRIELVPGAMTAALLLSVIRPLFGLVLRFNPDYGYAFGSLKAIFLLIVWTYYTFAVVLLGAEVIAAVRRKEATVLRGLFLGRAARGGSRGGMLERLVSVHPAGNELFREGDPPGDMFYILDGRVRMRKGDAELAVLGDGDYFGEMSLLLDSPRTASAVVDRDGTRLVTITAENLETILRENPDVVRGILTRMASRLRSTDELVRRPDVRPTGKSDT